MRNQFLETVEKALETNLVGYQKARKAFAKEYAVARNTQWNSASDSAVRASETALRIHTVKAEELIRWAVRCERAFQENFHYGINEYPPTIAVMKCLD